MTEFLKTFTLTKPNLITILGLLELYGWNVFIHSDDKCFITKDNPKDYQEMLDSSYVCFKINSESILRVAVHVAGEAPVKIDDFSSKSILASKEDVRILTNGRDIIFKNFSQEEMRFDHVYKRRSI